ncbi:hypothetical protein ACQR09_12035 [Bradyrhizobium oligotrophicum]
MTLLIQRAACCDRIDFPASVAEVPQNVMGRCARLDCGLRFLQPTAR